MDARQADLTRPVLDRRAFLGGATAALPFVSAVRADEPDAKSPPSGGERVPTVIVRQKTPDNLEFPFASLDSFHTPNELFYVRSHFDVPKLDAQTWRLKVEVR